MESFRADIQGLRAVAVLLVIGYHAGVPGFAGGYVGVDVFFTLSGFVIGTSLIKEFERTNGINVVAFYERRLRRLFPALALMTVTVLVLSIVLAEVGDVQQRTARTGLAAVFSVSNLFLYWTGRQYFDPAADVNAFQHTWSLGVEEQFYIVAPALLAALSWFAVRRAFSVRGLIVIVVGGLSVVSFVAAAATVRSGASDLAFYAPHLRFWEIGVGLVLAAVRRRQSRVSPVLCASALAILILATMAFDDATPFPGLAAAAPVAATLVLVGVGDGVWWWVNSMRAPVLQWLGDRSYGWYLWHWPFVVFAAVSFGSSLGTLLLASALALVPTAVSYRFVEQPIRAGRKVAVRPLVTGAFASLVAVSATAALVDYGANRAWGLEPSSVRAADNLSHLAGCHAVMSLPTSCVFEPQDGSSLATVLLVGDSHAAAHSDGVVRAANDLGWTVVAVSNDGCLVFDIPTYSACREYRTLVWRLIEIHQPELMIMAHDSLGYIEPTVAGSDRLRNLRTPPLSTDERLQLWAEKLDLLVRQLDGARISVISIDVVPAHAQTAEHSTTLLRPRPDAPATPLSEAVAPRRRVVEVEHEQLAHHVDVVPAVCFDGACSEMTPEGEWIYYDRSHLNRRGSLLTADILRHHFAEVADEIGLPAQTSADSTRR